MKMLVCVKQVPDTTEIRIDPVKNTLIRDGVPSIVNPFDAYALEIAARIKDETPGSEIVLMCMGPEQAKAALKECLAVGGDRAYLISGREFGGSDTLATSYILATAIRKLEAEEGKFDIIFCGKQAIDGDMRRKNGGASPCLARYSWRFSSPILIVFTNRLIANFCWVALDRVGNLRFAISKKPREASMRLCNSSGVPLW